MADRPMPRVLRWLLFVVGTGGLVAAGLYFGKARVDPAAMRWVLRGVMFLLIGIFCTLMYGENETAPRGGNRGD